jgi:hypothetical protein
MQLSRQTIFSRENYILTAKIAIAVAAVYAILVLGVVGVDTFVVPFTDNFSVVLGILTIVTVFALWRRFIPYSSGRPLWIWFLIGWTAWGFSEILYMAIIWFTGDVPYPGAPDFFYVLGYIGLIIGLQTRIREVHKRIQPNQRWLLLSIFILLMSLTFIFAILPVIQYPSSDIWTSLLDAFYPTADLILILLGIRLLFDYNSRQSHTGWRLIIIGFILMYVADLVYAYASTMGLLFPDGKMNLVSGLGYVLPYDFAYAFWMMGMYGLQVKLTARIQETSITQPVLVENTHILISVDPNFLLTDVSGNYVRFFGSTPSINQSLDKLLPIHSEAMILIRSELTRRGRLADYPVEVNNRMGEVTLAKLSGISILDDRKKITGFALVLRVLANANNLDLELDDYQHAAVDQVRLKSGSREADFVCAFLHSFYLPFFKRTHQLILENGGLQMGVNFEEYLNRESRKNHWKFLLESGTLEIVDKVTPDQIIHQLPELLQATRIQLEKIIEPEVVESEIRRVRSGFTNETLNNLYYIQHAWVNKK